MDCFKFGNLTIYRSVFEYINSNMYALIENSQALIVDPHEDNELLEYLKDVKNITILLTHEHPDHISGIYWLQEKFKTTLVCTKYCANYISQERNVRPILITFVLEERDRLNGTNLLEKFNNNFVARTYLADVTFEKEYKMNWCNHNIEFFEILGHSKGSCAIIIDNNIVFTGDSLMKDLPVITRFPGGNKKLYISETLPKLENKLQAEMMILAGHGEPFKLKEIMQDNKILVDFR